MQSKIPLYRIEGVTEAKLEDNAVRNLEDAVKEYTGYKYVIAVSSGTSALFVSASVYHLMGFCVIGVPSVVFSGTISAFERANVYVDFNQCEASTGVHEKSAIDNMWSVEQHLGACTVNSEFFGENTIEDVSHAFCRSVFYTNKKPRIAVCSLHASKPLQGLEGGLIMTNEKFIHDEARAIVDLGRSTDDRKIMPEKKGMNFRIHPLAASIARENLRDIDEINYCRRERIEKYRKLLDEAGIQYQLGEGGTCYMIALIDKRDDYIKHNPNIGLGVHYPFYGSQAGIDTTFNDRCVSLPLWSGISDDEIEHVVDMLYRFRMLGR